jgi:hypothetical protein
MKVTQKYFKNKKFAQVKKKRIQNDRCCSFKKGSDLKKLWCYAKDSRCPKAKQDSMKLRPNLKNESSGNFKLKKDKNKVSPKYKSKKENSGKLKKKKIIKNIEKNAV